METDKKCHSLGPLVYFSKTGNLSQIRLDPPTLANLGILNCYFFIADLASMSHDQDFKYNLFFFVFKSALILRKNSKMSSLKKIYREEEINFLSVTTPPKKIKKKIL